MAIAIGIDLGTTNSVAAVKKGDTKIVQNRESEDSTKSCVSYYKGRKGDSQILVGSPALDKMLSIPKDTIISIKRLIGRGYSDSEIQRVKDNFIYEIVTPSDGTDDDLRVVMGGKQYSPVQISSMILKKIKEDSEARLNDKVEEAVITVPAYFTDKQRDATREAGWLTGLKVQKILPEPTAAAIAYGVDNISENEAKTILVYDLGGGTFDVSILSIAGGIFAELGIEGNMWLGGDDFDQKIMDYVIRQVEEEYEMDVEKMDESKKWRFKVALKREAEKAKKTLSSSTSTEITLMGMLEDEEKNLIDVVVDLTRDEFEQMIQDDIKKSIDLVHTAIKNAHLTVEQIDNVILVGGSTMVPMIKRALSDVFGNGRVLMNVDPLNCVAQGAAILSARLAGEIECPACKALNSKDNTECTKCKKVLSVDDIKKELGVYGLTAMDYGILTVGDKFEPVIKKGSPYPSPEPVVETFYTSSNNMRRIKVPVFALDENVKRLEHQAIVWLELPEGVPHDTPVDVTFALDNDGILERVKVSLKDGSGREVEVTPDRGDKERSQVEKKIDEIKNEWDRKQVDADAGERQEIEKHYGEAIKAANANDIKNAKKHMEEFEKKVKGIGKDESDMPEWMRMANAIANYTDFVIEQYGSYLDPQKTYKLKKLIEEAKSAVDKEDQELAVKKTEELNKELDDLPVIIRNLLDIRYAITVATNNGNVVMADKIRSMLFEMEAALKRNDADAVNRLIEEIKPLYNEIFEKAGQKPGDTPRDERLKRKKGQITTDTFQS